MLKSNSYDYIICGAGCAGLSLLLRMLRNKSLANKKILLIDKEVKTKNDRTWCYWEREKGFFDEIVYKRWDKVSFLSNDFSSGLAIDPYEYKMIRGADFYNYCFSEINKNKNVEVVYGDVKGWEQEDEAIVLKIDDKQFRLIDVGTQIFNSIYKPAPPRNGVIKLLQHFKGWVIETAKPSFNSGEATMMDFRVHQQHGTTFAYVLPFSTTSALIEYTLFTKTMLDDEEYDKELRTYINDFLNIDEYIIKEVEFGVIPMTNEKLTFNGHNAWMIGTAGGQTKSSSGYTFQFIQKQSMEIVEYLAANKSLNELPQTPARFRFYDNTLLHILFYDKLPGDKIFSQLFKKNKPQQVLRFLDNESSLQEELKIISSLPTWPFLKAAIKQV
ncbi:hypothetical protein CAP36_06455 [Chitinophagaceae bacterium IBVUCB2]|nr:hypothetical protein CAP36_06455 [Chitinophagaceae bacterium IBVUCB2]